MEMSRTAVGLLAGLCLAGGATGAYFVARTGTPVEAESGPVAVTEAPNAAAPDAAPAAPPVASARNATPVRPETRHAPQARVAREQTVAAPEAVTAESPAVEPEPVTSVPVATGAVSEVAAAPPAEPAAPTFEELVISADAVVGLQVETAVTSETARVEDEVVARVTRDIRVGDRVAIPAGSKAYGTVSSVGRGGRLRDRARLGVRFNSIVLADGTRVAISTDTIYREGDSPTGESTAKIGGGALGGAIIGGILGGGKGAAIGGSIGAGAGTAAVMAGGRKAATLPAGTTLTVRLLEPASVTVEQ
jgi:hypothetical protein